MINYQGDRYTNYPDHYTVKNELKCYSVFHKYVQLLHVRNDVLFQCLRCEVVRARNIVLMLTQKMFPCVITETEQAGSGLVPKG